MISTAERRPPRLKTVRRQLDRWRRTRAHARAPLPDRLWAAAAALVPEHGLYGTARALGVSYGALKRHVGRSRRDRDEPTRTAVRFVELPPVVRETSVIEIEGAGPTVRVRVQGLALSDLAAFARQLAGAGS